MIPVTVVGGYLGAGKTTLVNHLLRNANGLRLAVLVNEFGELAIDEDLIEAQDDDVISIAGGCVCCSFGSDLIAALGDMAAMDPPPDHVLIESSGVAIPSSIVNSLVFMPAFRSDGIVILADAETVQKSARDKYMGDTVTRQIADADIILLNKVDLVSKATLDATRAWLYVQNRAVRVVESTQSVVPPETVLDSFIGRARTGGAHLEAAHLDMLTLMPKGAVDADVLAAALADEGTGLVRAKGFVTQSDGSKALIQVVGRRFEVTDASNDKTDGVVCLGFRGVMSHDALQALV
ncbi:GTP-binding protein [Amylibacter sp.]|nr:GTP-binding protein [Amylibacter sp.]